MLEQARKLAEPLDDPETLTRIYAFLSGAYQHMARLEESMAWARQCLRLGERFPRALALGYEFLAEALNLLGRWDESLAYSARTAEVGERIGEQHRLSWSHYNRAQALYGRGDLAGALEAARTARTLTEVTGDRRLRALARALVSQIQTDLAHDEAARADAQAAVVGTDELGDRPSQCTARYALAYLHAGREEWEAAADIFKQCATQRDARDNCEVGQ